MPLRIRDDYQEWINEPKRKHSPEIDWGVWWRLSLPPQTVDAGFNQRWRVSWIDGTGELYAKELYPGSEKFILIGVYPTREAVEARMEGWAEGGPEALTEFFAQEFADEGPTAN